MQPALVSPSLHYVEATRQALTGDPIVVLIEPVNIAGALALAPIKGRLGFRLRVIAYVTARRTGRDKT